MYDEATSAEQKVTPKQRKRIAEKTRQARQELDGVNSSDAIREWAYSLDDHESIYPNTVNKKKSEVQTSLLDDPQFKTSRERLHDSYNVMADRLHQSREIREALSAVMNEETADFDFNDPRDSKTFLRAMKVAWLEPLPLNILLFLARQNAACRQKDVRDLLTLKLTELLDDPAVNKDSVGDVLQIYLNDEDAWIRIRAVSGMVSIDPIKYEKFIEREWNCGGKSQSLERKVSLLLTLQSMHSPRLADYVQRAREECAITKNSQHIISALERLDDCEQTGTA